MNNSSLKLSDKKEFIFLDFAKLLCAFLVAEVHINYLGSIDLFSRILIRETFCRIAVPFFFISSGFFYYKKLAEGKGVKEYITRICSLYAVYTAIYLLCRIPQIAADPLGALWEWFKKIFIYASYIHLWYMIALIASCLVIFLLHKKLKVKIEIIAAVSFVFYLCGTMLFSYGFYFRQFSAIDAFAEWYYRCFFGIENAFFIGLLYVSLGCLIKKYSEKIKNSGKHLIFAIIFTALTSATQYVKYIKFGDDAGYLTSLFMVPAAVCWFICVCLKNTDVRYKDAGVFARKESSLIYFWHMFIVYFFSAAFVHFSGGAEPSSRTVFFAVLPASAVLSAIIIRLSQTKKLAFLKKLY